MPTICGGTLPQIKHGVKDASGKTCHKLCVIVRRVQEMQSTQNTVMGKRRIGLGESRLQAMAMEKISVKDFGQTPPVIFEEMRTKFEKAWKLYIHNIKHRAFPYKRRQGTRCRTIPTKVSIMYESCSRPRPGQTPIQKLRSMALSDSGSPPTTR